MLAGLNPDPPIRAKVRAGTTENGKPKATTVFHSTDLPFNEAFGTPKTVDITIPFPTVDEALRTSLELWRGNNVLKCWCKDMVTAHRLQPDATYEENPCRGSECPQYTQGNCKPVGRLRFLIPALGHGLFQIDTKSWHSISGMTGTLQLLAPIDPAQPFTLSIVEKKNAGNKKFVVIVLEAKEEGAAE